MAGNYTNGGNDDPPPGTGGRSYFAEVLERGEAKLSDYRFIRRALNEGFPLEDTLKALIGTELTRILTSETATTRAKLACMRILIDAQRVNLELIKLGHKDLHQFEVEGRRQNTAGKLPANDPDAPDSVSKQPTKVSLENFVLSLPELKIADESRIPEKRTG